MAGEVYIYIYMKYMLTELVMRDLHYVSLRTVKSSNICFSGVAKLFSSEKNQ